MPGEGRHFATVLFLDIVGSTQIADELGDADWHRLLARFRSTVRTELKRHGGHEVDTAGDGFFATFTDPLAAIRAADAIARAVQELGLDVRAGIHAGEVEAGDKHVTGMTVHVGARTMAFAGPARTAVTSTVRDMEVGGPVGFEDAGEHELKGVPGTWHLSLVGRLDEREPAGPLDPSTAPELRGAVLGDHPKRRVALVAAAAVTAVALVVSLLVWARPRRSPSPPVAMRPAMLKIDLASHKVVGSIDVPVSEYSMSWAPGNVGGDILHFSVDAGEIRDMTTGALESRFPIPGWNWVSIGGGYAWVDSTEGHANARLLRMDEHTGTVNGRSSAGGQLGNVYWGPHGGWSFMSVAAGPHVGDSLIANLDPISLSVQTWPMPLADWSVAFPREKGVWALAPFGSDRVELAWFDFQTHTAHEIRPAKGQIAIVEGPDTYNPMHAFLFDPGSETLIPLGDGRLETSRAIGVIATPQQLMDSRRPVLFASSVGGTLWVAAYGNRLAQAGRESISSVIVGIPEEEGAPATWIAMPTGFEAHHLLADPDEDALWVGSCYCWHPF